MYNKNVYSYQKKSSHNYGHFCLHVAPSFLALLCVFTFFFSACAAPEKEKHTPLYQKKVNSSLSPHFQYLESRRQVIYEKNSKPFRQTPIALIGTGKFIQTFDSSSKIISKELRAKLSKNAPGSVSLNFTNVPVREAAKAILGEILELNYSIDEDVSGVLNFKTKKAIPPEELISVFEELLSHNGLALSEKNNIYYITKIENAFTKEITPPTPSGTKHFLNNSILPIKLDYISASQLQKVLQPIVSEYASLSIDRSRNILFVKATRENLQKVHELVNIFDVDWMRGLSFAIYPLSHISPKTLLKDLRKIFKAQQDASLLSDLVEFIPLDRMNSILVITKNAHYLPRIAQWVHQLDQGQEGNAGLYIYKLNYAKADRVSEILKTIFNAGASIVQPIESQDDENKEEKEKGKTSSSPSSQQTTISPIQIHHDARNNSIIIRATPAQYRTIENAIKKLDVLPMQVMIEATIAEVTLTDGLELGLNAFFNKGKINTGLGAIAPKGTLATIGPTASTGNIFSFIFNKTDLNVTLNALQSMTDLKVLSAPHIMVLNNESASLNSGEEVPVRTQGSFTIGDKIITTGFEYRKTGVTLDVTPHISPTGTINLEITQSISNVTPTSGTTSGQTTGSSNSDTPTISNQSITTMVSVKSGQTVALGGLITEKSNKSNSGIPFVKNIPILGTLASSRSNQAARSELLVLITPHIIQNSEHVDLIRNELQNKMMITTRFTDNVSAFYDKNYNAGTLKAGWATPAHPTLPPVKFTHSENPNKNSTSHPINQFADVPLENIKKSKGTKEKKQKNKNAKRIAPTIKRSPSAHREAVRSQKITKTSFKTKAQMPKINAGKGTYYVQLTAVSKPETAINSWKKAQKSYPELLGKLSPLIREPAEGKKLYCLQTGPFTQTDAKNFCSYLKATGSNCIITSQ